MAPRIALVTSRACQHLDEDLPLVVEALRRRSVPTVVADWHDDSFGWSDVDLAVVRSPWDYTWQLGTFLGWADRVAISTTLANPADVLRWNTDKRYLVQLAAAGLDVVPTVVLEPGDEPALPDADEVVVKPVVSAGAKDTERYGADQAGAARQHAVDLLAAGRPVLIQPYLRRIDDLGETSLVYVGDRFSHGFRKGAILRPGVGTVEGLYREEDIAPRQPSPDERHLAEATLDLLPDVIGRSRADLLYARVDLAPADDGTPRLLELELTEPSLFCAHAPGAADRAADAFLAAAHRTT